MPGSEFVYTGTTLNELRRALEHKPYNKGAQLRAEDLPQNPVVDISYLGTHLWNSKRDHYLLHRRIAERGSERILEDRRDEYESGPKKMIHSNGISFIGEWQIESDRGFTGYFTAGSRGLFVGRASVLDGVTVSGPRKARTAGFAGKLFPTLNPDERVETANFVMIDSILGQECYWLERILTNNPPISASGLRGALRGVLFGTTRVLNLLEVKSLFERLDATALYRPVGEISHLGLARLGTGRTPVWMRLVYVDGAHPIERLPDFRQELWETFQKNGDLTFSIEVTDHAVEDAPNQAELMAKANIAAAMARDPDFRWHSIGKVVLKEIFASEGADHRVRFHHARVLEPSYDLT